MADPSQYRPRTSDIPTHPGVYRFLDEEARVIYVGKAKNLRNRLTSYFQDLSQLHPRTQQMVTTASAVKWVVVASDVEALSLEYAWIKEFSPRFNVMYRDDKSYPYLAISMSDDVPRMYITREAKRKGVRYFGPYAHVWAIRETVDLLQKAFPLRTCSNGVYQRSHRAQRPCLLGYIERCSAPCVGAISIDAHRQIALDICEFMSGKTGPFLRHLHNDMTAAAKDLEFEKAAKIRDQIDALETVLTKNAMVLDDGTDADVFALAVDELEAAVQLFHVRAGRIRGERGWVVERTDDADAGGLMQRMLQQIYGEVERATPCERKKTEDPRSVDDLMHLPTHAIPQEILVSHMPAQADVVQQWLEGIRGSKISLRTPQRGQKKDLMETVLGNAVQILKRHKSQRVGDLTHRSKALEELYENLELPRVPLRIECYDISHTAGTHQMASMVVFEDGMPRKSDYRTFAIRNNSEGHADDTAAMSEVLQRRFARLDQDNDRERSTLVSGELIDSETGRPKRFSYRPDLVVVDGGLPQVNAAQRALDDIGANVAVVGLAKRLEEVWIAGQDFPVILPRASAGLYILQYLRDESHRFAIKAHRKRRAKTVQRSVLDQIPGVGTHRQKQLLKALGSVKKIREASVEQLSQVDSVGPALAEQIFQFFHGSTSPGKEK
ncbi:MAG: excinuclease ABC subunit UvrC [Actinomycetaceae bacterium]|nr:excinuclease ABC subunit UvrC [Actinomycetaceae bacterium]